MINEMDTGTRVTSKWKRLQTILNSKKTVGNNYALGLDEAFANYTSNTAPFNGEIVTNETLDEALDLVKREEKKEHEKFGVKEAAIILSNMIKLGAIPRPETFTEFQKAARILRDELHTLHKQQ